MASEYLEDRNGVYYVPGTRISLDSIVMHSATDRRRKASARISRD